MAFVDKEAQRAYQREWVRKKRQQNKDAGLPSNPTHHARREVIKAAKDRPCLDCGVQYPYYVMQFDHVRGEKLFDLRAGHYQSYDAILQEIDKCEVVCANCHAARTWHRVH